MVFNPDDPHNGHSATEHGFIYRMVHVGPDLVAGLLADMTNRPAALPLFAQPVVRDAVLAARVRELHTVHTGLFAENAYKASRRIRGPPGWCAAESA